MASLSRAVFISYASQDAYAAGSICAALRAQGIEVWFDQDELRGGDAWDQSIRQQIRACLLFIAVISAHTDQRDEGYFRREWKLAVDRTDDMASDRPFLVPVTIDGTSDAHARVPDKFRQLQWTKLPNGSTPKSFVDRVEHLLALATSTDRHVDACGPESRAKASHPNTAAVIIQTSSVRRSLWIAVTAVATVAILLIALRMRGPTNYSVISNRVATPELPIAPLNPEQIPEKSVAVLPFTDLSEKHDQGYFADGISEEIIERLSKSSDLRVSAQASSFFFKGKDVKVSEIGQELRVANIVQGSLRKAGNHLRIGAQLVKADGGYTLWSDSFDRDLHDIFSLQDEIATAVATALQAKLGRGALTGNDGGTRSVEAYQLHLKAVSEINENTSSSLREARNHLEAALKIDPGFAGARSRLASIWLLLADRGEVLPQEGYGHAREIATDLINSNPTLGYPHAVLGYVLRTYDWNWKAARIETQTAVKLDPGDYLTWMFDGLVAQTVGKHADADKQLRTAVDRNPLDGYANFNFANALYLAGNYSEAETVFRSLLRVTPSFEWTRPWLAKTLIAENRPQEALDIMQPIDTDDAKSLYWPIVFYANGLTAQAETAMTHLKQVDGDTSAYFVAQTYAYLNNKDEAFAWLDRAYAQKDSGLIDLLGEPLLRKLEGDRRYKAFLKKMNLLN